MEIVQIITEVIKYLLPAMVVYFLMRQFIRGQVITEQMKIKASMSGDTKALRLQAYERLILLCERINLMPLMMRVNNQEITTDNLKNAMILATLKEYEHNLTQQIYVSGELWEMVTFLKDNVIGAITQSYQENGQAEKSIFENDIMKKGQAIDMTMGKKVKEAIRKELEIYFQ